jgi:hypothetical protein
MYRYDDHIPERQPDARTAMCLRVQGKQSKDEGGPYTGSAALNHSAHGVSLRNVPRKYMESIKGACDE